MLNLLVVNCATNIVPATSGVVIYLAWSKILFSTEPIFKLGTFVINSLISGVLFSTSPIFVSVLVTKPLISGILFSTSPEFESRTAAVTKPLISYFFINNSNFFLHIFKIRVKSVIFYLVNWLGI